MDASSGGRRAGLGDHDDMGVPPAASRARRTASRPVSRAASTARACGGRAVPTPVRETSWRSRSKRGAPSWRSRDRVCSPGTRGCPDLPTLSDVLAPGRVAGDRSGGPVTGRGASGDPPGPASGRCADRVSRKPRRSEPSSSRCRSAGRDADGPVPAPAGASVVRLRPRRPHGTASACTGPTATTGARCGHRAPVVFADQSRASSTLPRSTNLKPVASRSPSPGVSSPSWTTSRPLG